jgi:hypothetical protein
VSERDEVIREFRRDINMTRNEYDGLETPEK